MRNLDTKGLSMSSAQTVSNMCNQTVREIDNILGSVNNASKTININGKDLTETEGFKMPENVIDLLKDKAKLRATQAFLMEAIKGKDEELKRLKKLSFDYSKVEEAPDYPEYLDYKGKDSVDEDYGWSQLSDSEMNEFWEAEAYASHIGQFIHKNGKLDTLRNELTTLKSLEWITVKDGEKTPIQVVKHHSKEQLFDIHIELSELHRTYEQKVNYFKAKVKNLVSSQNAKLATELAKAISEVNVINDELRNVYNAECKSYSERQAAWTSSRESERELAINAISLLRITVPSQFKETVDDLLPSIEEGK
jgi:hypothetical protein